MKVRVKRIHCDLTRQGCGILAKKYEKISLVHQSEPLMYKLKIYQDNFMIKSE
jgi:hypothetical protein